MNKFTTFEQIQEMATKKRKVYAVVPKSHNPEEGPYIVCWTFSDNTRIAKDLLDDFMVSYVDNRRAAWLGSLNVDKFRRYSLGGIEYYDNFLFAWGRLQLLKA